MLKSCLLTDKLELLICSLVVAVLRQGNLKSSFVKFYLGASALTPLLVMAPVLLGSASLAQTLPTSEAQATATYNLLYVNPNAGDDALGNGSQRAPFKTITQALGKAPVGTVIVLAPGVYSQQSGETFPLQLKPGVTLQGAPRNRGQATVIRGGGTLAGAALAGRNVAIVAADGSALTGVTVTNPQGIGLWVESGSPLVSDCTFQSNRQEGITLLGNGSPLIRNSTFQQNGTGLAIGGTAQAQVVENLFERTGAGLVISQEAAPLLVGNRIRQNQDGVVVQGTAQPILRSNLLEGNEGNGIKVIGQANPDLGTSDAPGNNLFSQNRQADINAQAAKSSVAAVGNQLNRKLLLGRVDLAATTVSLALKSEAQSLRRSEPTVAAAVPVPAVAPAPRTESFLRPDRPAAPTPTPIAFGQMLPIQPRPVVSPASTQPAPTRAAATIPSAAVSAAAFPTPASLSQPTPATIASPQLAPSTLASPQPANLSQPIPIAVAPPQTANPPEPEALPVVRVNPAPTPFPKPAVLAGRTTSNRANSNPLPSFMSVVAPVPLRPTSAAVQIPVPSATSARPPITTNRPLRPLPPLATSSPPAVTAPRPLAAAPAQGNGLPLPTPERPIEIPVPPPEATPVVRSVSRPPAAQTTALRNAPPLPLAPQDGTPPGSSHLLPVPSSNIPIGNTGGMPKVRVPQAAQERSDTPPLPPSQASLMGIRYRVVVAPENDNQRLQVSQLVPDAFPSAYQGRSVMQVGAFGERGKADQLIEMLSSQGLKAMMEEF